jgi:hypothetical protein
VGAFEICNISGVFLDRSKVLYLWVQPKIILFKFTFLQCEYAHYNKKVYADYKDGLNKSHTIFRIVSLVSTYQLHLYTRVLF